LGVLLFAIGFLIVSDLDRRLETFLVDISPPWLTHLTTQI
jgi:cytochrome c-type biogenesis protein